MSSKVRTQILKRQDNHFPKQRQEGQSKEYQKKQKEQNRKAKIRKRQLNDSFTCERIYYSIYIFIKMKKNKKQLPKQIFLQRIKCDCIGQKHELVNNCLSCGKVVCTQEGEGPCLYCGEIVTRPDGQYITKDDQLFPTLPKSQLNQISKQRSEAILHKNLLVEKDQSTNPSQNIYDEHVDYYDASENQWLDEEDRKKAVDKLLERDKFVEEEQFKQRVVFDPITGKFITQEFEKDDEGFKKEGKQFMQEKQKKEYKQKMEKAKKNWDTRMAKNEKMQEVISEIIQKDKPKEKEKNKINFPIKNHITEYMIEDEPETEEILKVLEEQNKKEVPN